MKRGWRVQLGKAHERENTASTGKRQEREMKEGLQVDHREVGSLHDHGCAVGPTWRRRHSKGWLIT